MKVSTDTKEKLTSYATSVIESYKVLMACLLSVFVPQYCPETKATCTMSENFTGLDAYNTFVLVFNFLTLGSFVYLYVCQNRRETYLINHLDSDTNEAITSLSKHCVNYPKILSRVIEHNNLVLKLTLGTTLLFSMNTVFSAILVVHYFYDGVRTATTLISSVLLVCSKLYSLYTIMRECTSQKETPLALSTFMMYPKGFNVIDEDYKQTTKC
jgi:hypothetical protein